MFHAYRARDLQGVAQQLSDLIGSARGSFPCAAFEDVRLLAPHRIVDSFLQFRIAEELGIAANIVSMTLDDLLTQAAMCNGRTRLMTASVLESYLSSVLADLLADGELPAPVHHYLTAHQPDEDQRQVRLYQLAERLAALYWLYSTEHPRMMLDWDDGFHREQSEAEEWQSLLYRRVLAKARSSEVEGKEADAWLTAPELLCETIGSIAAEPLYVAGFRRVPPLHLLVLKQFALTADVHLITSASRALGKAARHPINRNWAGGITPLVGEDSPFPPRSSQPAVSDLMRLQRDVADDAAPQPESPRSVDGSIQVTGCPSIQREAEIIANQVWSLLKEPSAEKLLSFSDIVVYIADKHNLDEYQAHLQSAFADLYDVPVSIQDLKLSRASRLLDAAEHLLRLPLTELTRPDLLNVMTHPNLRGRFPETSPQEWTQWCAELSIFHGANHADHLETYITKDLYNWDQGFRRLALGMFLSERPVQGSSAYCKAPILSVNAEPTQASLFIQLGRSLIADAEFARGRRLTLTDWASFLSYYLKAYLNVETDDDQALWGVCRRQIQRLRDADVDGKTWSYQSAAQRMLSGLADLRGGRGYALSNGVVISALAPHRVVPSTFVFVAGLGEGRFPDTPAEDALNLLDRPEAQVRRPSAPDLDRFEFLHLLTSAGRRLYLSYVSRDAETGDSKEPSSIIHQLRDWLKTHYCWELKITPRRLRRFDDGCAVEGATTEGRPVNYSRAARAEAVAKKIGDQLRTAAGTDRLDLETVRQRDPRLAGWLKLAPLPTRTPAGARDSDQTSTPVRVQLSLADLRYFLEFPLQGWAKSQLRLQREEDDGSCLEDEPFLVSPFEKATMLREAFLADVKAGLDPEHANWPEYYRRAKEAERAGAAPTGLFLDAEMQQHRELLCCWLENFHQLGLESALPLEILRFGRAQEDVDVDSIHPALELELPPYPGAPAGAVVELVGRTQAVSLSGCCSVVCLLRPSSSIYHFLRGYLDYLLLFATGLLPESTFRIVKLNATVKKWGPKNAVRRYRPLSPSEARSRLADLCLDLLGGPHDYFLPFEVVEKYYSSRNRQTVHEIVESLKNNDYPKTRSEYGPIRNPQQYDPPNEEEAVGVIQRRYGAFFDTMK